MYKRQVVSILGILAAVAIPLYQGKVGKTQVSRVVGELGNYRTAFEARLQNSALINNATLGHTLSELTTGDIATEIATVNADGSGHIEVTMGGQVQTGLAGIIVRFERTASGVWSCVIDPAAASGWKTSFTPTNCTVI